ncbi:uncharacterized protein LOC133178474 [Saccostrea echinata]|uniref:uncharacterized protein LOC133178474 n=1 Tax=Saccostrea echinata TaxID=191078 RepID=UPI002A8261D3|nr:uncharacterized protein LOC133178474 [Saccostrea echinata]
MNEMLSFNFLKEKDNAVSLVLYRQEFKKRLLDQDQGIQSVAELKIAVAEALNSSKDLIEIVDKRTLTLYHDDIDFPSFLKHEDDINVIERTETRESHYEQVENNQPEIASDQEEYDNDENVLFLADRDCTHITNPDLLFKHIHHEVLIEENTKITCLKCGMEMMTDNALQMCNMSEDETCFYKEKIIRNRGLEHQLLQLGMQWSVKSEYADNINKS